MKYLKNEQDAEDMVLLVFEKLFSELKKKEVLSFKSWIYTVAKNQCLMSIRHERSVARNIRELTEKKEPDLVESESLDHLFQGDPESRNLQNLAEAISKLRDPQKKCIQLFYLEQKSYAEVAELTGYGLNEVKSHLQNGRRNLKILLENMN